MPYVHEYINQQEMAGTVKYTLKLTDSDGILPEQFIPIILHKSESNEERLFDIAKDMIIQVILENQKTETVVSDETDNISQENVDNTSTNELNIQ